MFKAEHSDKYVVTIHVKCTGSLCLVPPVGTYGNSFSRPVRYQFRVVTTVARDCPGLERIVRMQKIAISYIMIHLNLAICNEFILTIECLPVNGIYKTSLAYQIISLHPREGVVKLFVMLSKIAELPLTS